MYVRSMKQESISLTALTELKYQRMVVCDEIQKRSDSKKVYALASALELLAIEKPRVGSRLRFANATYVVVSRASERYRLKGVSFVTWQWPLDTIVVGRKFVCTSPVCTWAMMSLYLSLEELVVLGDSMMRRDNRLRRVTLDDFAAFLKRMADIQRDSQENGGRAFKGMIKCQRALRLMRENCDSSQETRVRLVLMRYGLPCPVVNYVIRNPHTGKPILLDMAYPEYSVTVEYEGGHHAYQWLTDTSRRQVIQDAGWECVQVTKLNLGSEEDEEQLARRVADALQRSSGRVFQLTSRQSIEQLGDGRRSFNRN